MASDSDLASLAETRSRNYWFLSGFYLERPERAWLQKLKDSLDELAGAKLDGPLQQLVEETDRYLTDETAALELNKEYTRLFRGLQKGYGPPPPYESVYREDRLVGECTADVISHHKRAGFGIIDPEAGPQDHMSAELKFLSLLCYKEHQAWVEGNTAQAMQCMEQQRSFLDEHLMAWLPEYKDTIEVQSNLPFYRAATALILESVSADRAFLDGISRELDAA